MKYYFIFLLLSFLTGCKESEKEKIARLVKEWDGKEISFPPHSVFTIQGKDTIDFSFADAEYKIVTYVDSVGCTSCKLQLPRWKEFMHEVDSLVQGKVPFVFYFHPKDVKELRYITRRDAFTYPVCIDEKDDFNALNRFPGEMTFQSFLLNRENKVIAIGQPGSQSKGERALSAEIDQRQNAFFVSCHDRRFRQYGQYGFRDFPTIGKAGIQVCIDQ